MSGLRAKIGLYIISLGFLFLFFIILTANLPDKTFDFSNWHDWANFLMNNLFPMLSAVGFICFICAYRRFRFCLNGSTDIPFTIDKIENISYQHLTFLTTNIIPLIGFDFDSNRHLFILFILLIFMGIIYIKTDSFYANPSLALFGFYIYQADGSFKNNSKRNNIILISLEKLDENQKVKYIKLDEKTYYVKIA